MIQFNASKLLEKEMDRKDFLKATAFGVLAMSGVAAALKATGVLQFDASTPANTTQTAPVSSRGFGYGASAYGGK